MSVKLTTPTNRPDSLAPGSEDAGTDGVIVLEGPPPWLGGDIVFA